jgi:hypothetical protein
MADGTINHLAVIISHNEENTLIYRRIDGMSGTF